MAIEALKKYVSPVLHIHTKEIETMETCDDWSSGASDAHIRHQFILEGHTGHTHDRNTITVNLIGRQPKPTISQRFRNYTTSKSTSYKISLRIPVSAVVEFHVTAPSEFTARTTYTESQHI